MESIDVIEKFLNIGYGYGSGDGSGYGDGYGSGDGSGDGSGYGSSYGDGYGDGSGIKNFIGEAAYMVDGIQTLIYSVHGNYAKGAILKGDLTLQPCFIARVGDFFAHGDTLHQALAEAQEKYDGNKPIEDRIEDFKKSYPSLESTGTGGDFYRWHHVLTGSCTAGRDAFCKDYGVEMDKEYTVSYFLELVKDAYGRDAIKQLRESYD